MNISIEHETVRVKYNNLEKSMGSASSLDGACGIRGFVAPIIPYSATLHTGYVNFELIDGAVWCYIGGIGLLVGRIFFMVTLRDRSADVLVRHVGLLL